MMTYGGATSQMDNIIQSLSPMRHGGKKDNVSATPKVIRGGHNGRRLVDEIIG
jgi:hypothetical protein